MKTLHLSYHTKSHDKNDRFIINNFWRMPPIENRQLNCKCKSILNLFLSAWHSFVRPQFHSKIRNVYFIKYHFIYLGFFNFIYNFLVFVLFSKWIFIIITFVYILMIHRILPLIKYTLMNVYENYFNLN